MELNQKHLNKIFKYDPETGFLYRKKLSRRDFLTNRAYLTHIRKAKFDSPCGGVSSSGSKDYIQVRQFNKKLFAHRIIWVMVHGYEPDNIDHIDGDGTNNKIDNLREVSTRVNSMNTRKGSKNTTGFIGVYRNTSARKPWRVFIKVKGVMISRGTFEIIEEAIVERKLAEREYGFHMNHGSDKC